MLPGIDTIKIFISVILLKTACSVIETLKAVNVRL